MSHVLLSNEKVKKVNLKWLFDCYFFIHKMDETDDTYIPDITHNLKK